jgi:hypothetical protein
MNSASNQKNRLILLVFADHDHWNVDALHEKMKYLSGSVQAIRFPQHHWFPWYLSADHCSYKVYSMQIWAHPRRGTQLRRKVHRSFWFSASRIETRIWAVFIWRWHSTCPLASNL